jgi:hypothetical protein
VIDPRDYFGDVSLQFDVVNHVRIRSCPIRGRHAHAECPYCHQRFVLDLETFDENLRQQLQDHAARHDDT